MVDWFSPSDVECPTIEGIEFLDRKTGKPVPFAHIPSIIFSKVMRDVDLVVSVAHVGGVNPEASLSIVEMRKGDCGGNGTVAEVEQCQIKRFPCVNYRNSWRVYGSSGKRCGSQNGKRCGTYIACALTTTGEDIPSLCRRGSKNSRNTVQGGSPC